MHYTISCLNQTCNLAGIFKEQKDVKFFIPGKSVLLTSHSLVEVDELCDRLAIMVKGEIVSMGTPAALRKELKLQFAITFQWYGYFLPYYSLSGKITVVFCSVPCKLS